MTGVRCELPGGCWLQELCSSMISDKYDTKPGRVKTSQPTNTTDGGDGMLTSMLSLVAQCWTFILLLQMMIKNI